MTDRDTLRNLLIAGGVFLIILYIAPRLIPLPPPRAATTTDASTAAPHRATASSDTTGATGTPVAGLAEATDVPSTSPAVEPTHSPQRFEVREAPEEQTRVMGSAPAGEKDAARASPYRMRLMFSNVGAAVETATMTDHAATVGSTERYVLLHPVQRDDGTMVRSLAVESVTIDDVPVALHDRRWHVGDVTETEKGQRLSFWIEIHRDGRPLLKITRSYELPRQPEGTGRHDLTSTIRVENIGEGSPVVLVAYRGGVGLDQTAGARMDDRYVDWGLYDPDDSARVTVAHKGQRDVVKGNGVAMKLYAPLREAPKRRLSWAATTNIYFTCTIAPLSQNGKDNPSYLADVSAIDLDGSPLTDDDRTVRFVTVARPLPPGRAITLPADVYLGEKDADAFRTVDDYVRRSYYDQIALGFGMCTFSWLVQLMIWLLNTLFIGTRDYGVAIIILVLIVRLMLHPITKKGQVNMVKMQHRMQEVAPKIEEIKKKYANDKVRMNQEMMKLNINPAGQMLSCLPMMIQMPIWVALYLSLSNNIGMRHQPAFWGLTWIHDLTAPDALYTFASPLVIPLLGWELPAFNLLPLLLAVFMYTQQKMQPKPKPSPNATDQQKQQQQMMQSMMPLMSIMMLIFFYKAPGGLNLYIMCSSLFGTIEQHYIRKHIKEREAAGTLHKPAPKDRDDGDSRRKPAAAPGFLERLQKMADQAGKRQHQAQRKPKPKPGR